MIMRRQALFYIAHGAFNSAAVSAKSNRSHE